MRAPSSSASYSPRVTPRNRFYSIRHTSSWSFRMTITGATRLHGASGDSSAQHGQAGIREHDPHARLHADVHTVRLATIVTEGIPYITDNDPRNAIRSRAKDRSTTPAVLARAQSAVQPRAHFSLDVIGRANLARVLPLPTTSTRLLAPSSPIEIRKACETVGMS